MADALEQGAASGVGGGSVDGAGAGGVDEGGKEKDVSEQVLPSSEELLAKIQVVDDAIAATDAVIANLQADALQGEPLGPQDSDTVEAIDALSQLLRDGGDAATAAALRERFGCA